jgi:MoxR-like ATPase
MQFKGTENYIASRDLSIAVNAAIQLEKPILIKGEPGTGKTLLAFEIAKALSKKLFTWHIKSTTTAQQGLYEYDAVSRLRDSQLGDEKINDISNYIIKGKLWEAFEADEQVILLIDEIDKADIEFPNDLLLELDKMEFYCYETKQTIKAKFRPIIIITSNNEKELPDAFLRRCFFHYISFPDRDTLKEIIDVHYDNLEEDLVQRAMDIFYKLRSNKGIKKKPSTSEIIDWLKLLMIGKITTQELDEVKNSGKVPPYLGALLKNEEDKEVVAKRY